MVSYENNQNDKRKLDVCEAVQAHIQWKQRLLDYIKGESNEILDSEVVGSDCTCSLGEWIYDYGMVRYGEHPKFQSLKVIHADFHKYAANVIDAVHQGENEEALHLLQHGEYPRVSNRIKSTLARLSLEFDFGL